MKLGKKGARGDRGINFDREASITREMKRKKKRSREGENGEQERRWRAGM